MLILGIFAVAESHRSLPVEWLESGCYVLLYEFGLTMILLWLILAGFTIYCGWVLVEKTGNPGWMSLLFLIPS